MVSMPVLVAAGPKFAPVGGRDLLKAALGARDLPVGRAVGDAFGGGDLVVAVADRQAQEEAPGTLGDLGDEIEREVAAHAQGGGLVGGRVGNAACAGQVVKLVMVVRGRAALRRPEVKRPVE